MRIDILKRAKINIIFGTINKIAIILCPFVQRIFIQKYFGSDYIGLNSLFSSIFSVLNLSELGLNSAILSFIYKPMADDDVSQVNSILNFYKKAYKAIGIVILILGLVSSIFIPRLARDSQCIDYNLYYIYFIMLFNCVIGYFLYAYVTCIFIANQRDDVKSNISTFTIVLLNISQIGIIIYTKNYYLFVLLVPIFTIITNILSKYYVNKLFPQYFPSGKIGHDKLVAINKLVAGSAISKISSASRHSLDSIFAAVFLGLTLTGFYNNYYMVLAGLSSFLSILATSFTGGIGNHIAYKTKEENLLEWKKIDFMYFAVSGCVTCILLCT